MNSISEIWHGSKTTFISKSLSQILSFAGDGKLRDNNQTSNEFRELLDQVPSSLLKQFANNCLAEKFDDGGMALQDIINQIGIRLGFSVLNGLYRGKQNEIGYDGIWTSKNGHSLIIEVKTTDVYRINLDVIASYRRKLVESGRIDETQSSILIVVGRKETGDLEAQIRGSQHAWDIRLQSTDSLLQLLTLKETLNDAKTIQQINELLKPQEYTRIDKLIDLIFLASQDLQLEAPPEKIGEEQSQQKERTHNEFRPVPVSFHDECVTKIENHLRFTLIKQTRISYATKDKSTGLICSISKSHKQGKFEKFWFAFHPYQEEFLTDFGAGFVAYGCGSPQDILLIPFSAFKPLIQYFWTTEKENKMYWHIVIYRRENNFFLAQPELSKGSIVDITKYKI